MAYLLDSRWSIVVELQQSLHYLRPGSETADIIEHAISLAINSKSQEINRSFFRHDIIRNARFSLLRTKARQRQLLKKAALLTEIGTEDSGLYTSSNLKAELREVVAQSGENLARCFDGMVNGESVAATALACGVSRRTVDRLRHTVRQVVQSYLNAQEVV